MEGRHANCCRFTTLTGVHQGAHICLAKFYGFMEKFGAMIRAELRNMLQEKLRLRCRGGSNCRFERRFGKKKGKCEHCNTGGGILALPRYRHWLRVLLYSAI